MSAAAPLALAVRGPPPAASPAAAAPLDAMSPPRTKAKSAFGDSALLTTSPFAWLASPTASLEVLSPLESTMSCSLSSPPHNSFLDGRSHCRDVTHQTVSSPIPETLHDLLGSAFSPSMFSPDPPKITSADAPKHMNGSQVLRYFEYPSWADPAQEDMKAKKPFALFDQRAGEADFLSGLRDDVRVSRLVDDCDELAGTSPAEPSSRRPQRKPSVLSSDEADLDKDAKVAAKKPVPGNQKTAASKHWSNRSALITPESSQSRLISPSAEHSTRRKADKGGAALVTPRLDSEAVGKDFNLRKSAAKMDPTLLSVVKVNVAMAATADDGAAKPKVACKCKKSRCLKLYCDCFAILNYCNPIYCKCSQCNNTEDHEEVRSEAIRITKERNSFAFKEKITDQDTHVAGCHCKNSHCLKKYCECFTGNALCSSNCKCQSCENFAGSSELARIRNHSGMPVAPGSSTPADAGSSSKKRKDSPSSVAWVSPQSQAHPSRTAATAPVAPKSSYSLRGSSRGVEQAAAASVGPTVDATSSSANKRYPQRGSSTATTAAAAATKKTPPSAAKKVAFALPSAQTDDSDASADAEPAKRPRLRRDEEDEDDMDAEVEEDEPAQFLQLQHKKPVEVFPFFGNQLPAMPKASFLQVLEHLSNKDIYTCSQVSVMWSRAAFDDALWESNT